MSPIIFPLRRLIVPAALLSLAACASAPPPKAEAVANLKAASGSEVSGLASFRTLGGGKLELTIEASGLTPGAHGFHIHEVGDCSAPDATSAKGHFNPGASSHGHPDSHNRHAGDMPNLVADAYGKASLTVVLPGINIGTGDIGILGRAVIIHADPDDYTSQPAGNAGKRVACGVIKWAY